MKKPPDLSGGFETKFRVKNTIYNTDICRLFKKALIMDLDPYII
jgi:hypothetical protein